MRVTHAVVLLMALSSTVGTAFAGSKPLDDVYATTPGREAIQYVIDHGIMTRNGDAFHPDRNITRAEFIKAAVSAAVPKQDIEACQFPPKRPFADVPKGQWYGRHLCAAYERKWVVPGSDARFRPSDRITVGEASVFLRAAFGLPMQRQAKGKPWYASSIIALADVHAIPVTVESPQAYVSRAEAAEMIWRLNQKRRDEVSATSDALLSATCSDSAQEEIPQVDTEEVRRVWLQWINGERATQGLPAYRYDRHLSQTAALWSASAKEKGSMSHKRAGQSAYYDYNRMVQWFDTLGLSFKNENRSTFTENIGWGYYTCKEDDCTEEFLKGLRSTFDLYLSEKGKAYRPHYNSIMNPDFHIIGMGVAADPKTGKFYVTTHYATEITSHPPALCR